VADAATGAAVGLMCLLHRQQPGVVGIGYWTVASRRRQGFTGRGLRLLSRWALGLPFVIRLEALVEPGNEGSIRVLEAAGFRNEAVLRSYFDSSTTRSDALLFSLIDADVDGDNQP
jgi:ribosomal-protein-alanine N-acetyltransferase